MAEQITAGEYELVALQWDEPTSKPGDPFTFKRHKRGDKVTLDEATARRLVNAGAVVVPGEAERQQIAQLEAQIALLQARLPEETVTALVEAASDQGGTTKSGKGGKSSSEPPAELDRPAMAAGKDHWIEYVVSKGTPRAEAEGMTVAQLQAVYPAE